MHIKTQLNVFPYFKLKQKTSKGGYLCIWVETQKVLHIINKYHFHSNKHFITQQKMQPLIILAMKIFISKMGNHSFIAIEHL